MLPRMPFQSGTLACSMFLLCKPVTWVSTANTDPSKKKRNQEVEKKRENGVIRLESKMCVCVLAVLSTVQSGAGT